MEKRPLWQLLQIFITLYHIPALYVSISFIVFPLRYSLVCGHGMSTWWWQLLKSLLSVFADYSVRSWSRPPRGTAPLLSEGRQRASMSRLWGHSEYSDPSDWSLEYPVSTALRAVEERKREWKEDREEKSRNDAPRGSGANGDWVRWGRNEPQIGADIAARRHAYTHTATDKRTHIHMLTHRVLLSCCQILRQYEQ